MLMHNSIISSTFTGWNSSIKKNFTLSTKNMGYPKVQVVEVRMEKMLVLSF